MQTSNLHIAYIRSLFQQQMYHFPLHMHHLFQSHNWTELICIVTFRNPSLSPGSYHQSHSVSNFIGTFSHWPTFIRRAPGSLGALNSHLLRLLGRARSVSIRYLWLMKKHYLFHKKHFNKNVHKCVQSELAWFLIPVPLYCKSMHTV